MITKKVCLLLEFGNYLNLFQCYSYIQCLCLAHALIKPVVPKVLETVLMLIRETVNDDLNGVIQRLIGNFEEDIALYAVNIAQHLADTFKVVLERDDDENVEDR